MMLKKIFYIFVTALFVTSCQEININKEVNYTLLLDSLLLHQNELLSEIDSTKINYCIEKSKERLALFELEALNEFQKQWLYHEKIAYNKIHYNLSNFNIQVDSLRRDLGISKKQISALKEDLIHRHLSKKQFANYFIEEQKALGKLNTVSEYLQNTFIQNTVEFDSLESKLKGIFLQLNTLKSQHE